MGILEKLKALLESGAITQEEYDILAAGVPKEEPVAEETEPVVEPNGEIDESTNQTEETSTEPEGEQLPVEEVPAEAEPPAEEPETPPVNAVNDQFKVDIEAMMAGFSERIAALEETISSLTRHEVTDDGTDETFGLSGTGGGATTGPQNNPISAIKKHLGF